MDRLLFLLLCGVAAVVISLNTGAANADDDGFVWIDANTRIKVKPVSAGGGAGATKAPEAPRKEEKKPEKPKK